MPPTVTAAPLTVIAVPLTVTAAPLTVIAVPLPVTAAPLDSQLMIVIFRTKSAFSVMRLEIMDEIYQQSISRVKEPTALAHTHARLIALQSFGMAVHSMDGLDLAQLLGSKQQLRGFAHDMAANQVSALEDMYVLYICVSVHL